MAFDLKLYKRQYNKEWRLANPDKYAEQLKRHRDRRRVNAAHYTERRRAWAKANPNKVEAYAPRKKEKARVWVADFRLRRKLELAGRPPPEKCEICSESGLMVFDHCHSTGKFRGWICNKCNVALGMARDNIRVLKNMIKYLKNSEMV